MDYPNDWHLCACVCTVGNHMLARVAKDPQFLTHPEVNNRRKMRLNREIDAALVSSLPHVPVHGGFPSDHLTVRFDFKEMKHHVAGGVGGGGRGS